MLTLLAHVEVDGGVTEVTEERHFVIDGQTVARKSVKVTVAFQLSGEGIEDFTIEVARWAIMLKDFNDAASLSDLRVLDDLLFKVGRANFLDMCCLLYLLTLIEVLKLTIEELLDQLVQVFSDFVEEHDFSVLMNI